MDRTGIDHNRIGRRRALMKLSAALVVTFAGMSLSACGKKGPPEPPKDESGREVQYPRPYPNPRTY
jgi:predicted small lipoprotein YifL